MPNNQPLLKTTWRHVNFDITHTFFNTVKEYKPRKNTTGKSLSRISKRGIAVIINGVQYSNIKKASEQTSISRSRIRSHLAKQNSCTITIDTGPAKSGRRRVIYVVDGKVYNGLREAVKELKISKNTLSVLATKDNNYTFSLIDYKNKKRESSNKANFSIKFGKDKP